MLLLERQAKTFVLNRFKASTFVRRSIQSHSFNWRCHCVAAVIVGARQFVENHFADMTIGRIRLLVDATFRRVRHLVENNSQVRHSVEIVKSLFFDQTSYSTEHRIYQMSLIIKKKKIIRNHFVYQGPELQCLLKVKECLR